MRNIILLSALITFASCAESISPATNTSSRTAGYSGSSNNAETSVSETKTEVNSKDLKEMKTLKSGKTVGD